MTRSDPIFTRLHIIRHGQTEWNKKKLIQGILDDVPINDTGRDQAQALAENLKRNYQVDVVYASKTTRAQQTAEIFCKICGKNITTSEDIHEIDFGIFSGSSIFEIEEKFPDYFTAFRAFVKNNQELGVKRPQIPKGETMDHIEARIKSFVTRILAEHRGKHIAAVSHGSFIKCLITYLSGGDIRNYMPYWVENASISVIDFFGDTPIIRRLNDTSHLHQGFLEFAAPRII